MTRERRRRGRTRGSVSIETLVVIGLVFVPIWGVMEYLHDGALAKGALRQEVRSRTMTVAATPDCGALAGSCARAPLDVSVPPSSVPRRWTDAADDRRQLHYAACAGSTSIANPRAGVENRGHASVYACQEPELRQPSVEVESILCGSGGLARGTDLCD